jgi:hypothetical protein
VADAGLYALRLLIKAKATIAISTLSRGGTSHVRTKAADHDFNPSRDN